MENKGYVSCKKEKFSLKRISLFFISFVGMISCLLIPIGFSSCHPNNAQHSPDGDLDISESCSETDCKPDGDMKDGELADSIEDEIELEMDAPDIDVTEDGDGDLDQDIDTESPVIMKVFSYFMDADDPLLQPGEMRVTTTDRGVLAPFEQYDVYDGNSAYCAQSKELLVCEFIQHKCFTILTSGMTGECFYPNIRGEKIVIKAFPDSAKDPTDAAILLVDEFNLNMKVLKQLGYFLAYNGALIAWTNTAYDIALYDILLDTVTPINALDQFSVTFKDLSNNFLVWIESRDSGAIDPNIIKLYNLESKETVDIATSAEFRLCDSQVSDKGAVWIEDCVALDDSQAAGRLIYYSIASKTTREIDPQPHPKDNPAIDGKTIVWTDFRNGGITSSAHYDNADIYLYDIQKNQLAAISTAPGNQFWPRISGRWVIYEDTRWNRGVHDVVSFDLCTLDMYKNDEMCEN